MSLKPWREIARPHKDVLEGSFRQAEFAADITQVASGHAPPEYGDAEKFFARTYITEGMRLLLISVAQRLAGHGGDPVIQLQTAFGGGKTHTLLAVYHLASRQVGTERLAGIPAVLDEAGIHELPQARMAVIDGINLAPSQASVKKDGQKVTTLWGEMAWQLLGDQGLEMVRQAHEDGTSPGKAILVELLQKAAPCVVLMDEMVAYLRQFEPGRHYEGGTFDANLSFIQALTEAMKAVPNAIMLASLPESDLEAGGTLGQQALNALEKYFARLEAIWKPVATEEAFEIVRRRLFEHPGERAEVEGIARQFTDFYRAQAQKFPLETQSNDYFERICRSYPIHPEVFDRLYEDWSTLDRFQRTRGVLQYMAVVIHKLWESENRDPLIMPGSLPLFDPTVRTKSIHYLPQGWEPVIEREVDGARSVPHEIDSRNSLYGSVQAARRTARTLFLGSAPSSGAQAVRGINSEQILLGAVQPGQAIGVFEDVIKHLRDRLHYLYSEQDRLWLDTKPNLRREMESRKQNIDERDELVPLIQQRLARTLASPHHFAGTHVFTPSGDIPDDYGNGPRLVALDMTAAYSRTESNQAFNAAEAIVRQRGEQPRQKQNRLLFLAPDHDVVGRLKEQGRTLLAWRSIVDDIESGALNQDISHLNQAKRSRDAAELSLQQLLRECWKWLMAPSEEFVKGRPELRWEVVAVAPSAPNLVEAIESKLREEEWLIDAWSPIHLRHLLTLWYFTEGRTAVEALKVWQDSCHYLYMPRLLNDTVFRSAISDGVASRDFFGFAAGKEGERYLGFVFGSSSLASLDSASWLIEREAAEAYAAQLRQSETTPVTPTPSGGGYPADRGSTADGAPSPSGVADKPTPAASTQAVKRQFYGTLALDPVKAKMDFATLMDEVVEQFTARLNVDVKISVEIEAHAKDGFDEALQRTVKENCSVLRFGNAEFEEGE